MCVKRHTWSTRPSRKASFGSTSRAYSSSLSAGPAPIRLHMRLPQYSGTCAKSCCFKFAAQGLYRAELEPRPDACCCLTSVVLNPDAQTRGGSFVAYAV